MYYKGQSAIRTVLQARVSMMMLGTNAAVGDKLIKLKQRIMQRALRIAMRRRAPDIVSYSKEYDNFHVILTSDDGAGINMFVDNLDERAVMGRNWSEEVSAYDLECCVPVKFFANLDARIHRFYGTRIFEYQGALQMIIAEAFGYPFWKNAKNSLAQKLYNSRTRVRTRRIEWLNELLRHRRADAISRGGNLATDYKGLSPYGLLEWRYGRRIVHHTSFRDYHADLNLIMDSLAESADAVQESGQYRASGKALRTIEEYQEENRRHRLGMWLNGFLVCLTAVLAIAAVLQYRVSGS